MRLLWILIVLVEWPMLVVVSLSASTQPKMPPSIAINVDPTIAIPERFVEFADDYFSNSKHQQSGSQNIGNPYRWVDDFTESNPNPNPRRPFSLLSWNILAQSLYEKGPKGKTIIIPWEQRLDWILKTIIQANADIVCLQEVQDFDTVFLNDIMPTLQKHGYRGVIQGGPGVREIKRRKGKGDRTHFVATFWKDDLFEEALILPPTSQQKKSNESTMAHMARGRTLTSLLKTKESEDNSGTTPIAVLAVVNCHLEGKSLT